MKEAVVSLPFNALVSDLLKDPIITNDKTSNDMLIHKIKKTFLVFNENNFSNTQSYSSVVVSLFLPEKIVIAHVGDSRAVSSDLVSIMTHDHKPLLAHEKKRIEKVGGIVVNNMLAQRGNENSIRWKISRMLGDTKVVGITAEPDVSIFDYNFKMPATSSGSLDTEFLPVSEFMKKEGIPLYTVNKTHKLKSGEYRHKSQSRYRFIIMANNGLWSALSNDSIADYSSYDFAFCDVSMDSEIDKESAQYQCSRLGKAEIATHIVESVLKRHGLNQKSLDLAAQLLHVASVQKEKFNLGSFLNQDFVQKKSLLQRIKEFFVKQQPQSNQMIINKNLQQIKYPQSIVGSFKGCPKKKIKIKISA